MASFSIRGWQHTHHYCLGFLGCVLDVSELWPSARQKGGHWRCFGSAGGGGSPPFFTHQPQRHLQSQWTPPSHNKSSHRWDVEEKNTSVLQLRTHTNQNKMEIQNPPGWLPSSSSPVVLPCHHHNRLPLLLLTDQYDTTISRRDIVNLSLPPFPSTAPTRPQPPSVAVVVVGSRRHIPKPGRPQKPTAASESSPLQACPPDHHHRTRTRIFNTRGSPQCNTPSGPIPRARKVKKNSISSICSWRSANPLGGRRRMRRYVRCKQIYQHARN